MVDLTANNPTIKLDEKDGRPIFLDQRELSLKYEIPVEEIYPFFIGLEQGKVLASKCEKCGKLYFPPQGACSSCRSEGVKWVQLSENARLLAATMIFVKPQSFADEPFYLVAVGRLEAEGINVLARLAIEDPAKAKIGMPIKLKVAKTADGAPIYCFTAN